MPELIDQLAEVFRRWPGVGPRQARRFVYHLLAAAPEKVAELARQLGELKKQIVRCPDCQRYFQKKVAADNLPCELCRDSERSGDQLMIVEKDVDLEIVRRSGHYPGKFFVLGGLLPILAAGPEKFIRLRALVERLKANRPKEIIIALAVNPEGDNTFDYLKKFLAPYESAGIKITVLGRGLSTGTELEYSDAETVKNALKNRA